MDNLFQYNVNSNDPRLDLGSNPLLRKEGSITVCWKEKCIEINWGTVTDFGYTERPYINNMVDDYRIACCPISLLRFQMVFIVIHIYYP